jgi:hypothetical protein
MCDFDKYYEEYKKQNGTLDRITYEKLFRKYFGGLCAECTKPIGLMTECVMK